jgi:YegS/Rv2252/BmrU family lipid kinase
MAKKILIIVNPYSGKGKGIKYAAKLLDAFTQSGFEATFVYTKSQEHTEKLARDNVANYDMYAVCGGDGTLNRVINGCIDSDIPIVFIPLGTVNIFAREFKIPANPIKAVKKISNGKEIKLDALKIENRYALLMCSAGFDSEIVNMLSKRNKNAGKLTYLFEALKNYFSYKFPDIKVKIDGEAHTCKFVFAGKCKLYAGFLKIAPDASLSDGMISLCLHKKGGFFSNIGFFFSILFHVHRKFKHVVVKKAKEVEITGDNGVVTQIDGEANGVLPQKISIIPGKLRFIIPQ